ncbi:hypothetical protein GS479_07255 [Rhodococcus hoagii]|nr:hypothetical protein [Prescottella equi]NKR91911.1 hypothetical protein [Prescottella equi]ORJ93293.1 hypothetical protein A6F58_19610 [Prescottella equi]
MTSGWGPLAEAAGSGELVLDRDTATRCAVGCDQLVLRLRELRDRAFDLAAVEGLGDRLPSGVALAGKFSRKASGGEYSLDLALADHITEVEQMRDVFLAIENRYAAAEEANTAATAAVESQIN